MSLSNPAVSQPDSQPSRPSIHFGTDGWRAVISDEFTFENVRHVAQAIADFVKEKSEGPEPDLRHRTESVSENWRSAATCHSERSEESRPSELETLRSAQGDNFQTHSEGPRVGTPAVVVGFDTRFLSDRYAIAVAEILAGNGIRALMSRSNCPTPALSYAVQALGAQAGVMITASHNPPRYNGLKLKAAYGGSAPSADTRRVEAFLAQNLAAGRSPQRADYDAARADGTIQRVNLLAIYLEHIRSLVDLQTIGHAGLRVVVDPMYGSGRGYLRAILISAGCDVIEIRSELNPGFGGIYPEPIERNLAALIATVRDSRYDVGLANDGDADRIGAVDAEGRFVDPHRIFALILRHLVEVRGLRGAVVKTISTTQMVNRLAERYGLPVYETPVGFNYISDLILANDVLIGGEESGGLTIKNHIPEGDGILMGLLLLEVMATRNQSLQAILDELMADLGPFHYARNDVRTRPFSKRELVARLSEDVPVQLAGTRVVGVNSLDGVKYLLEDDSWLLIRPSGTEPVLRIYAEARSPEQVQELLKLGAELAGV